MKKNFKAKVVRSLFWEWKQELLGWSCINCNGEGNLSQQWNFEGTGALRRKGLYRGGQGIEKKGHWEEQKWEEKEMWYRGGEKTESLLWSRVGGRMWNGWGEGTRVLVWRIREEWREVGSACLNSIKGINGSSRWPGRQEAGSCSLKRLTQGEKMEGLKR